MKELSIEEKAKRYDEALKVLHKYDGANIMFSQSLKEEMFPELKESEDERIRKELISWIISKIPQCSFQEHINKLREFVAWLEKQDTERKQLYVRFGDIPSNEKSKIYHEEDEVGEENGVSVYPAFELNGNIVLGLTLPITKTTLYTQQHLLEYDNRPCYLVSGDYVGKGTDGEPLIKNISVIKRLENYRIKECEQKPVIEMKSAEESLGIDSDTYNKIVDECIYGEQKPVDLPNGEDYGIDGLYAAIDILQETLGKVEGYQTDDGILSHKCAISAVKKLYKQNPAWSEEDEAVLDALIRKMEGEDIYYVPNHLAVKCLKSLKDRYTWKPSDKQIEALDFAADCIVPAEFCFKRKELKGLLEQLKKLKEE